MLVTIHNGANKNIYEVLPLIKRSILRRLLCYGYKAEDIKLSHYLKEHCGLSLRAAAMYIYNNIAYSINVDNDLIITTKNKKADLLASIINYGTMTSGKSDILSYAFTKK